MGRFPTASNLAILRGNPGKRRIREEPKPAIAAECPEPPAWLPPYAVEEWRRVAPALWSIGLLTHLDYACLGAYAGAYSHWRTCEELARKRDGADGRVLLQLARQAAAAMLRFASQMGCSPVARARIGAGIGGQDPGNGKFGDLLARAPRKPFLSSEFP
jgi:P27 family predicted phage terminase small subunit